MAFASLSTDLACAFAPASVNLSSPKTFSLTALNSHAIDNEDEGLYLMMKARECAHSDSCSIEEAENYLQDVLALQGGCAAGTLHSEKICNDTLLPSEIIGSLRDKIEKGAKSPMIAITKESIMNPTFIVIATLYLLSGTVTIDYNGGDAFTIQEWWWAIRDGYVVDMFSQFMKNGGLAALDSNDLSSANIPFTTQEWFWAARDGYLGNMISYSMTNSGMTPVDASDVAANNVMPFTPVEWIWSIRDGYFDEMISAYMKHGGLEASNFDTSEISGQPFVPQEWAAAAKDGYLNNMVGHYLRNGGL
eukprot:CAMPEP_0184855970 /NCGR_PEP_ID=MMETSP0580-20130426/1132_1 /TAXON_ID=1118495 /ORGANISM="Dactyliosolen fragilissimus" /LENGTH=304 /DNA_ID=CAMNT_0027350693 /DNA_START=94 /DNA_END=1008 /DNA_ORIENTATION=-